MISLKTELPSVDLRTTLDGVARRWWIVVGSIAVTTFLVFAQDSGLRSEPQGKLIIERSFEATFETDELDLVKIDPSAINPVPSFDNQILLLNSIETANKLRTKTNSQSTVSVTRSEPKFTLVEALDDQNNRVSFISTGTPMYSFRCEGSKKPDCLKLIREYVRLTIELRRESLLGGLDRGVKLISNLISLAKNRLANPGSLSFDELQPQRQELASLVTKLDALKKAQEDVSGDLIFISEATSVEGKSIASVTPKTYGFGFGLGLAIGLFISLQLASMEKTIRHHRQVWRVNENVPILGSSHGDISSKQKIALAASLQNAQSIGTSSALVVTHDSELNSFAHDFLSLVPSISASVVTSATELSVDQLAGGHSRGVIILVRIGQTTRQQLTETLDLVMSGGNRILGVALVP